MNHSINQGRRHSEFTEILERLVAAASNPRNKAYISVLANGALRVTESVQLREEDIDLENGTLYIVHLKERVKLKCPCGEVLGKRHLFCPRCGSKVSKALREKAEQRRHRVIPIGRDTLRLLDEYLKWRRKFSYKGPLVFPFTRQRGWQIIRRIGQRAGIVGLHPHSLRHMFATQWVAKGLDVKKLQLMLGHTSISTTWEYVHADFEQLKAEYLKLWENE